MAETFTFELVSPEKLLFSREVTMVTVPGSEGEYGILAGHTPLITKLKPGVIEICVDDDATVNDRIFVGGGFAEVTQSRFTVLAQDATPVAQLNRAEIEEQSQAITTQIAGASDEERSSLLEKQALIEAKLQAAA